MNITLINKLEKLRKEWNDKNENITIELDFCDLNSIIQGLKMSNAYDKVIDDELHIQLDNLKDKTLEKELEELEECFKENGYTKEMTEEVKYKNDAETLDDFIDNLQEERSCWEC